ncbi:MAG: SDR family oxidoreductase [Anaerolineales bacterium]|nr:SDR family oxidoreductase [Anaerolineales bacterium]
MSNQLALITGASSGIGEAFARQLAERGYDLCLTGRRSENLESIAVELRGKHKINVEVVVADLAAEDGINMVISWIRENQSITMLVNNAGFGVHGLFANKPPEKYVEMITVHVTATMRLTSAALPAMIKAKQGAVINVSSVAAYMPLAGNAVYSGTKSFLNAFTVALAFELKNTGVKVQLLTPGFTYSDFHKRPDYAKLNTYSSIPKFMWMKAEEVVRISLHALERNKRHCIPGMLNKLIVFAGKSGLAALSSKIMARRYKTASK